MKKVIKIVCCLSILFGSLFGHTTVFAESEQTYFVFSECFRIRQNNDGTYLNYDVSNNSSEVRIVTLLGPLNGSNKLYVFALSTSDFYGAYGSSSACSAYGYSNATYSSTYGIYYKNVEVTFGLSGTHIVVSSINASPTLANAYYYSFGAGAVGPTPPTPTPTPGPSWGDVANVSYATEIAGQGRAAVNNVDVLRWESGSDSNGNVLPASAMVEIRAVPGKYTDSSKADVIQKAFSDFILDSVHASHLEFVEAEKGEYRVQWSDVISELELDWRSTQAVVLGSDEYWLKQGWIYQMRLRLPIQEHVGEWVTVRTATSSGVENDLQIINATTIDYDLIQAIQNINTINNVSNVNNTSYSYNNVSVDVSPEPGEGESDSKPWWAYILEAIGNLISSIVDGVSSIVSALLDLVGDLIDGLLGLFRVESFAIPDFSENLEELEDNSGVFGESEQMIQDIHTQFSGMGTADPVLYYPGLELDGVDLIPETTVDLNDYFDGVMGEGAHETMYFLTDAFVYISLIVLVTRKLITFFRRG